MKPSSRILLLFALVLTCRSFSFGWGCSGHQIVALIAERQLNPTAFSAVQSLLKDTDIYNGLKRFCAATDLGLMASYASWADDYRDQDKTTAPWHFWDIPLNETGRPKGTEFCDQGCVIKALQDQIDILKSPTAARPDKAKALAFIIHLVGDMHQPLHIISNNDRGGNCVPVTFFGRPTLERGTGNFSPNLHGVWDTDLLEQQGRIRKGTHDDDVSWFVNSIFGDFEEQVPMWAQEKVDILEWAIQSHHLARSAAYGHLPHHITAEAPVNVDTCNDDKQISHRMLGLHESISKRYATAVSPVIEEQLARAGTRLAVILNDALGK